MLFVHKLTHSTIQYNAHTQSDIGGSVEVVVAVSAVVLAGTLGGVHRLLLPVFLCVRGDRVPAAQRGRRVY